ncbi:NmrA/HSCARG family protein [Chitinophaga sp.]|uniref:NmrA/HSCARG family protein n=1 Tax=Chitinophaga sp. TaxID=1869181 RepID=UPI002F955A16
MEKKIIAVVGATGLQGKGVVNALMKEGSFKVRAITRDPNKYQGQADEVAQADLMDPESLINAFKDAHGVFVVTNFWEGADELAQGDIAVKAAKKANVNHFVWSTLPNVEKISNGQFVVPQFTGKAKVDSLVRNAGFANYTFVQPPFYFQNFKGHTAPQQQQDGSIGWMLPIDPNKKVIHMGDISDLGKVVAGAFLNPGKVGKGSYLSLATELNSFNDVLKVFKANGKEYSFNYVPAEVFSSFFEGAGALAQLLAYFESYSYMGPSSDAQIQMAKEISTEPFTPLDEWIKLNAL